MSYYHDKKARALISILLEGPEMDLDLRLDSDVNVFVKNTGVAPVSVELRPLVHDMVLPSLLQTIPNVNRLTASIDLASNSWGVVIQRRSIDSSSLFKLSLVFNCSQDINDFLSALAFCAISALPTELMAEIFCHYSRGLSHTRACAFHSYVRDLAPLFLPGWVCTEWRDIASQTVQLWANPYFSLTSSFFRQDLGDDISGNGVDNHTLQMVKWLERTNGFENVNLTLHVSPDHGAHSVLRRLASPLRHVRHLHLKLSQSQLHPLLDELGPTFPQLEHLHLMLHDLNLTGWAFTSSLKKKAPNLRSLLLLPPSGHAQSFTVTAPPTELFASFPLGQLTNIAIHHPISTSIWRNMLRQCTSLCTGHFQIIDDFGRADTFAQCTTFPNLVSLDLRLEQGDPRILDNFHLPVLQSLGLRFSTRRGFLPKILRERSTPLRFLMIGDPILPESFLDVLRLQTKLERLSFNTAADFGMYHEVVKQAFNEGCVQYLQVITVKIQDLIWREDLGQSFRRSALEFAHMATAAGRELRVAPNRRATKLLAGIFGVQFKIDLVEKTTWEDLNMVDAEGRRWTEELWLSVLGTPERKLSRTSANSYEHIQLIGALPCGDTISIDVAESMLDGKHTLEGWTIIPAGKLQLGTFPFLQKVNESGFKTYTHESQSWRSPRYGSVFLGPASGRGQT
ncbi:hypothetical protein C8R43DRAFT_950582 [Mycena crocata]|nr:hypothetical protein C8R43DRAFT_950582 [Mycena crocata]